MPDNTGEETPQMEVEPLSPVEEAIRARRSIRKFVAEPVPAPLVERLLKAAMAAPSASNRRPWEFVVVDAPALLEGLQRVLIFGRYQPPLAIVVCGNLLRAYPPPVRNLWIEDCSAAAENILLAATGLGLGGVWVGIYPMAPFINGVRKLLGLPKTVVPLGALYIGRPAEERPPRTQYDEACVHHNGY